MNVNPTDRQTRNLTLCETGARDSANQSKAALDDRAVQTRVMYPVGISRCLLETESRPGLNCPWPGNILTLATLLCRTDLRFALARRGFTEADGSPELGRFCGVETERQGLTPSTRDRAPKGVSLEFLQTEAEFR